MAQAKMQCQECRVWLDVEQTQVNMPTHYVTKHGRETKCPGHGRVPLATRGFKRPPPSIE